MGFVLNFNSLQYLLFLAANVAVYYLLPPKYRNIQLLASSYFFYMCWNPKYALLMLLSTGITYFCGRFVQDGLWGKRRFWIVLSFSANLAILFFFKYFNFFGSQMTRLLTAAGLSISVPMLDILLPVGISFYTFQALGYTVDVFRKEIPAERSFVTYALFVSFFPQLVAGPIERASNMLPQLKEEHRFSYENVKAGTFPVLWGLFKKVVVADNLAILVNTVYNQPQGRTGMQFLFATAAFAVQIYCDFSAYSDIARGSAKMLGFDLMRNFDCPYLAVSIKDFWRRWHISLSSWFKDYLYFPLGGSRCSRPRYWLNLVIVFTVSGLWHGAALTFVAWGMLNGLYQVLADILSPLKKKVLALLHLSPRNPLLHVLRIAITFALVCLSWVLFRANSLSEALMIFRAVFSIPAQGVFPLAFGALGLSRPELAMLALAVGLLFSVEWLCSRKPVEKWLNRSVFPRYAVYFLLIVCILLFGSYGTGYAPQNFVYFQF